MVVRDSFAVDLRSGMLDNPFMEPAVSHCPPKSLGATLRKQLPSPKLDTLTLVGEIT